MIKKRLNSGKLVDVENLTENDILINDIVHSLANTCRYDGHVPRHYSVLEHSILVCKAVPSECSPHIKLMALLHDATECYIGDMQSGIKDKLHIEIDGKIVPVREFERSIMLLVCKKFGIVPSGLFFELVEAFDKDITAREMEHFLGYPECKHYEMFEEKPADWYKVEFARLFWGLCNEVDKEKK